MPPDPTDAKQFAANARILLTEDPSRYRNFGVYWFFVKALLMRLYSKDELPILGAYVDQAVVARMPAGLDAHGLIAAAAEEYAHNASFNLGRNDVEDPEGESFFLYDPDVEG